MALARCCFTLAVSGSLGAAGSDAFGSAAKASSDQVRLAGAEYFSRLRNGFAGRVGKVGWWCIGRGLVIGADYAGSGVDGVCAATKFIAAIDIGIVHFAAVYWSCHAVCAVTGSR